MCIISHVGLLCNLVYILGIFEKLSLQSTDKWLSVLRITHAHLKLNVQEVSYHELRFTMNGRDDMSSPGLTRKMFNVSFLVLVLIGLSQCTLATKTYKGYVTLRVLFFIIL